ncbi:hypothetical protein CEXT_512331 [Caerostris extrusa]|uniref:ARID domain-containing protein n=1 Tax=Caerostris extrusa TaxID=172846 RepID=A0AAV4TDW8_CAEEX|nr:hypothetical protein CEXT_512331 [Caerostris extrusa]
MDDTILPRLLTPISQNFLIKVQNSSSSTRSRVPLISFCLITVKPKHFKGTPVNRIPIMAKQVLDLYELYRLVVARGGLVEVINKKFGGRLPKV